MDSDAPDAVDASLALAMDVAVTLGDDPSAQAIRHMVALTQSRRAAQPPSLVDDLATTRQLSELPDSEGNTALHVAAAAGHQRIVTLLQTAEARSYELSPGHAKGWTPLHAAASANRASVANKVEQGRRRVAIDSVFVLWVAAYKKNKQQRIQTRVRGTTRTLQ